MDNPHIVSITPANPGVRLAYDPDTNTHWRSDGSKGVTCGGCGFGYVDIAALRVHHHEGCDGFAADLTVLREHQGDFEEGYEPEDIDRFLAQFKTVDLICLWEYQDDIGFGGDSEVIGCFARTEGPWFPLADGVWAWLIGDPGPAPEDLASILADVPHEFQDLGSLPATYAYEDRTCD